MEEETQINNPQSPNGKIDWGGDVQRFFAEDLKDMFVNTILRPVNGVKKWFAETRSKSIVNPLCMLVIGFLLSSFIPFLIFKIRIGDFLTFGDCVVRFGLLTVFYAIFVTVFMFIFLAIKKQPDIIYAFRNSSVHVFLLTLFIVVLSFIILIFGDEGLDITALKFGAVLILLAAVYAVSLGISAVRQVLSADSENPDKDLYSWYISPLVLMLSLWLADLIVSAM